MEDVLRSQRLELVTRQLEARDIVDRRVLDAMRRVPRHRFVPPRYRALAYEDRPLPIGYGQTISQPYIVALMLQALRLTGAERVLDIGTGSGYLAALLGELATEVYSVEIVPELAASAAALLTALGYRNVRVIESDGSLGFPPAAPYDAIVVAAAAEALPAPLVEQIADPGRMVVPVGPAGMQSLVRVSRLDGHLVHEDLGGCVFVPLVSRADGARRGPWHGWPG